MGIDPFDFLLALAGALALTGYLWFWLILQEAKKQKKLAPDSGIKKYGHFGDLIFADRKEAEFVLEELKKRIAEYKTVTVADFYDLIGMNTVYADQRYGWRSLEGVLITDVTEGYVIYFPWISYLGGEEKS